MEDDQEFLMILFGLSKAIRFCQQEEICGEAITFGQFNIINLLFERKSMRMSDLNEALTVDKSTTTRLVEPLVAKALVVKEKSPRDARVTLLSLTEAGREVRNRAWECLQGFIRSVEAGIPENQRPEIYAAVKIFAAALRDSCCCGQSIGRCWYV